MDAVFYPVALNAIPKKKKPKPAEEKSSRHKTEGSERTAQGWKEIASFLGQPIAVSQRWARSGMPVTREGRFMYASRDVSPYLGREAGLDLPVHTATAKMDLSSDLRRDCLASAVIAGKKAKVRLRFPKPVLSCGFRFSLISNCR